MNRFLILVPFLLSTLVFSFKNLNSKKFTPLKLLQLKKKPPYQDQRPSL